MSFRTYTLRQVADIIGAEVHCDADVQQLACCEDYFNGLASPGMTQGSMCTIWG